MLLSELTSFSPRALVAEGPVTGHRNFDFVMERSGEGPLRWKGLPREGRSDHELFQLPGQGEPAGSGLLSQPWPWLLGPINLALLDSQLGPILS